MSWKYFLIWTSPTRAWFHLVYLDWVILNSPNKKSWASSHAVLEHFKQKSLVDDKIKGRHGNRDFFFSPWDLATMGEKHEGNTEEGDGSDEERVKSGIGGREWGLNLQDPRNTWQRTTVKTAETARMSPPAIARAHGKSPDLTIWVTPHQAVKTGGWGGRKTEHVGWSFVSLFFFSSPALFLM